MSDRRRFARGLAWILAAGAAHRALYLLLQPGWDPTWDVPVLDGAVYVDWARGIGWGDWGVDGAFYLAPLYPAFLAGLFAAAGESLALVYAVQQALVLLAAGLGAAAIRTRAGDLAGWCAAALLLAQHAWTFFPARVASEPLALALAMGALFWLARGDRPGRGAAAGAGALAGLAALARPNLLLLPAAWAALLLARRRPAAAALLVAGCAVAVAPIAARNLAASGHLVPVTSNAGITAWHGNAPGARGVYTHAAGFRGSIATQREEATRLARKLSGDRGLDAVEADRWWGRRALAARLDDPAETLSLLGRRVLLTLGSRETGLDALPAGDLNPARPAWPGPSGAVPLVPFGLLAGLAAAGWILRGFRASGGGAVWGAIAAAAATPLLFYVSSRYRLPLSALIALPAGAGLAALLCPLRRAAAGRGRRIAAAAALVALFAASWALPRPALLRGQHATALGNGAVALERAGRLAEARRQIDAALALDAGDGLLWFNAGRILERSGDDGGAAAAYGRALEIDPERVEAATNLGALHVRNGRAELAVPVLEAALARRPDDGDAHTNLVVAWLALGRPDRAREAAERARSEGVALDPELLREIGDER